MGLPVLPQFTVCIAFFLQVVLKDLSDILSWILFSLFYPGLIYFLLFLQVSSQGRQPSVLELETYYLSPSKNVSKWYCGLANLSLH